jgi:NitT/TauT family transport system ATP-binding protein
LTTSLEIGLSVKDLSVSFIEPDGYLDVLEEISFSVKSSSFVSLIGPSGGGKSTLLRVLAGLVPPNAGEISFFGKPSKNKDINIGIVFQSPNLMPWRNVLDNISLPLQLAGFSKNERWGKAMEMVDMVGLRGFEKKLPDELSGGMAQRVAIARALIHDPDILLLDEPFASLDALTRERMGNELLRIWQTTRKTVLMVTHSISEAVYLSDRVLVLTQRPARLCLDLPIALPRPREDAMRYSQAYIGYNQQLHQQLTAISPPQATDV